MADKFVPMTFTLAGVRIAVRVRDRSRMAETRSGFRSREPGPDRETPNNLLSIGLVAALDRKHPNCIVHDFKNQAIVADAKAISV